jgi:hypothetical protein
VELVSTIDDVDPIDSERDSEESGRIEVEVVDEIPPPNFNPPLRGPFDHILLRVRGHFSEIFCFSVILTLCQEQVFKFHHKNASDIVYHENGFPKIIQPSL